MSLKNSDEHDLETGISHPPEPVIEGRGLHQPPAHTSCISAITAVVTQLRTQHRTPELLNALADVLSDQIRQEMTRRSLCAIDTWTLLDRVSKGVFASHPGPTPTPAGWSFRFRVCLKVFRLRGGHR